MPDRFGVSALAAGSNLEELSHQISRPPSGTRFCADAGSGGDLPSGYTHWNVLLSSRNPHERPACTRSTASDAHDSGFPQPSAWSPGSPPMPRWGKRKQFVSRQGVLVAAGEIVMAAARQQTSSCFPWTASTTPSTNACAPENKRSQAFGLTASAGPSGKRRSRQCRCNAEQALAHPNWRMGRPYHPLIRNARQQRL